MMSLKVPSRRWTAISTSRRPLLLRESGRPLRGERGLPHLLVQLHQPADRPLRTRCSDPLGALERRDDLFVERFSLGVSPLLEIDVAERAQRIQGPGMLGAFDALLAFGSLFQL